MSGWQAYVTEQLMKPGEMSSAGIYGLDGGEWARDGCIQPSPEEIKRIIKIVQDESADINSIKVGGSSYLFVKRDRDDGSILLNRIGAPSEKEKYVICACLAKTCILVGVVAGNFRVGNCSKTVIHLRDYLKQSGF